jgi:hypothetical protein
VDWDEGPAGFESPDAVVLGWAAGGGVGHVGVKEDSGKEGIEAGRATKANEVGVVRVKRGSHGRPGAEAAGEDDGGSGCSGW